MILQYFVEKVCRLNSDQADSLKKSVRDFVPTGARLKGYPASCTSGR